ncbi:MAG: hypothetical protein ABIS50_15095 [Luteolibacter sp.]|uniref:hypothetical protein n=1 Tax=Luteolibacter sp. TaxID=1962973 RepID=UPI0032669CFD
MREPERPSKGNALLTWALQAWDYMRANMPKAGPGIEVSRSSSGTIISLKQKPGGTVTTSTCPFGEITTYSVGSDSDATTKTGIRGGWIKAGKKNWRLTNREINLEADGVFPVWIEIIVTANTDADNIATLSGLKTSERPTWEHGADSDADYGDSTIPDQFPTTAPGHGVLIVPIGMLTVKDGKATLAAIACGHIIATHCPGTLDHYRGPVVVGSDSGAGLAP